MCRVGRKTLLNPLQSHTILQHLKNSSAFTVPEGSHVLDELC